MKSIPLSAAFFLWAASTLPSSAEPIGRWWIGFGQGNTEYGVHNDSSEADTIYIACGQVPTTISFRVGGVEPAEGEVIVVTIDDEEFELLIGTDGQFKTASHVASDTFNLLWDYIRSGDYMRVRLGTGESTVFTLAGTSSTLPKKGCSTDFERY